MMSAEPGGILWLAEIAMLRAIHQDNEPRTKAAKRYKVVR